jgi:thiamine biosynthesis lipoprotein
MTTPQTASFESVFGRIKNSSRGAVSNGLNTLTFTAMSTTCRVNFHGANPKLTQTFQQEVLRWVAWFESYYSRFIPDSLIGKINSAAGIQWVDVDPETDALFNLCNDMVFFTKGVFDPTTLPLMKLWNWKNKPPVVPTQQQIAEAKALVGWRKVERRKGSVFLPQQGMSIDLGGIGKEYAVDRVVTMGIQMGIQNILVDFGQDVRVNGEPPERGFWHIGLEDPNSPGKCWTGVAVRQHAVATSGDYIRSYIIDGRRYGHILDPRDGYPVNNGCMAVSIIAPHCTMAGILSTAAFVLGPKEGLDLISICPGTEGAITTSNGRVQTRNFHAYSTSKQ